MTLARADRLLVEKKLVESRSKAADLIRRGRVFAGGKPVRKPGTMVPRNAAIVIKPEQGVVYVSRGGYKLAGALKHFGVSPGGKIALDCGASTGGFTDCLLQHHARRVYAVDVGYGQLHWKLRQDKRVIVLERKNFRYLTTADIPEKIEFVTLDMSFISLKLVMDVVHRIISPDAVVLAMVKPQFEAGKDAVGSGGVIRNPDVHRAVLQDFSRFLSGNKWHVHGIVQSSVMGPKGNKEFFFHLTPGEPTDADQVSRWIDRLFHGEHR